MNDTSFDIIYKPCDDDSWEVNNFTDTHEYEAINKFIEIGNKRLNILPDFKRSNISKKRTIEDTYKFDHFIAEMEPFFKKINSLYINIDNAEHNESSSETNRSPERLSSND